jgi:Zn-dependent M16 (insulinase) family peptidase
MTSKFGFDLVEERDIPELNSKGRLYQHTVTGARLLSIVNDDENKVFSINFRTTPQDSTGVAHILEHAVLNGSEKYPVKEPFVELLKGSLQTFVNAFTFPDKTCYPVASQNLQDFYNLIDVYMDATLHPLIPPHILDQEGWHFGVDQESGNLVYKGVVFNEMKGALSNPNDLLGEVNQQSLFPDTLYRHNSGGDPRNIPDLTYEQFKEFHATYYHPSNAYIYWYGDDNEEERLKKMSEYLEGYSRLKVDSSVPLQAPFDETLRVTMPYAVSEEEPPRYYVSSNWVLTEQTDPVEILGLGILNHILVGTSASPLRKALIDSGYGEDLVGGGLNPYLRQLTFSTGLKGVRQENTAKVENLIEETLAELAREGIDLNMVAAAMNTIEFQLRENNTGAFPRGLLLMLRTLTTWLYDSDPFTQLAYEAPLQAVKDRLEGGQRYFESLIQKYFLDNPHRSTVVLEPDPDLNRREAKEEASRLKAIQESLSDEDLERIIAHTKTLKSIQETPDSPEALATLPSLTLGDLDKKNKTIPLEILEQDGVKILYHDLFTNGIVYFDLSFDLAGVPQELLPYLKLFAGGLVKMGTQTEDYVQLSQRIGRNTGGISPSLLLQNKYHSKDFVARLVVRAKSTMDKVDEMLAILEDILLTTDYNLPERFRQILTERKAKMEAGLVPSGHAVVNRRLQSGQSMAGWLDEQTGGIENLYFSRELLASMEEDWENIAAKFSQIRDLVVNRNTMLINVTLDQENWQQVRPKLGKFFRAMPQHDQQSAVWQPGAAPTAEGLTIPAQVNYVGKGANLYDLGFKPHGSINVIRKYLGTTYIWEKIRVQGGAYGGFISFDLFSGSFNYISYRDPNLIQTLQNYDGTANFLRKIDLSGSELVKSIIGTIGDMDGFQLPDSKGFTSMARYLTGYDDEIRQQIRDQILSTTAQDFKTLADVLDKVSEKGVVAILGSVDAISEANQDQDDFLTVKTVL